MDAKIPRWLRPHIPLVVSGGQIVWVAGLRPAEPVKVTEASRTLLTLEISPQPPKPGGSGSCCWPAAGDSGRPSGGRPPSRP